MGMKLVESKLNGLVYTYVDPVLAPLLSVKTEATLELSRLDEKSKRRVLLNLKRGYAAAQSGLPYRVYHMLARLCEFPIYAFGASTTMRINVPDSWSEENIKERLAPLWQLATSIHPRGYQNSRFWCSRGVSLCPGFRLYSVSKPDKFSAVGLCSAFGIEDLWEWVPKIRVLNAIALVEQGGTIKSLDKELVS